MRTKSNDQHPSQPGPASGWDNIGQTENRAEGTLGWPPRCLSMHQLYSQQSDVPSALGAISPIFPYPEVPPARNFLTLIFPRPCVPSTRCCFSPVFPRPDILSPMLHQPYLSFSPMSPQSCMCSLIQVVPHSCVPSARCFHSPVFPQPFSPSACCSKLSLTTAMIEETFVFVA